jgi:hypothetical protein
MAKRSQCECKNTNWDLSNWVHFWRWSEIQCIPRAMWTERRTQSELKLWLPIPIDLRVQICDHFYAKCLPAAEIFGNNCANKCIQTIQLKLQGCHRNSNVYQYIAEELKKQGVCADSSWKQCRNVNTWKLNTKSMKTPQIFLHLDETTLITPPSAI